jgi:dUTP pyrophosphatase
MSRYFEEVKSEFKKNDAKTMLPLRKTKFSAGYDLLSPIDFCLKPKEKKIIWMDVKACMPDDEVLMVYIRSSLGIKYDVVLANGVGVIDADYYSNSGNDGNIGVCLKNNGKSQLSIVRGEGIAQCVFTKYLVAENCNSEEERVGGVGSTTSK